jgi:hypothetical protein
MIFAGGIGFAVGSLAGKQVFLDAAPSRQPSRARSASCHRRHLPHHHAYPKAMRAAVAARGDALRLLGVTVLTSMVMRTSARRLRRHRRRPRRRRAADARPPWTASSPRRQAAAVRALIGPDIALVTPGVPRPAASGDQNASRQDVPCRRRRLPRRRPPVTPDPAARRGHRRDRGRAGSEGNMSKGYWIVASMSTTPRPTRVHRRQCRGRRNTAALPRPRWQVEVLSGTARP